MNELLHGKLRKPSVHTSDKAAEYSATKNVYDELMIPLETKEEGGRIRPQRLPA